MSTAALWLMFCSPFAGAALLWAFERASLRTDPERRLRLAAWLAAAFAALAAGALISVAPAVIAGEVQRARIDWLPVFGVGLGLRLDALALIFCGLILGIGLLVVLYARYYLSARDRTVWFYTLLLAFMGAMLGIALADNLIMLGIAWELTSLISFLLIGFWPARRDAREGARMALTLTGAGGLALLAGLLLLGWIAGSWQLDDVLKAGPTVREHAWYPVCLALVLLGAATKSAQFPFHFWLPQAMAAPTPASAYLHSATMVKAGIFLLARLYPVLSGTDLWFVAVTTMGAATLLTGAWHAIFQHDLKGLLAYSTISHLGLIVMLLGLDSPMAAVAAVFHLLNHATFKASLFMTAGIIDHETGTRDMRKLQGLAGPMPVTATVAIVSAAAMAGVPLLNGFLSKEMFFAETLAIEGHPIARLIIPAVAALAAALSVAYSARFVHDVFFNGAPRNLPRDPHEPPLWMRLPVALLAVVCLLVGLLPGLTVGTLLDAGARDMLGREVPPYSLAIWHGFNVPLAMSMLAMAGGTALYFWLQRGAGTGWRQARGLHERDETVGLGQRGFHRVLNVAVRSAGHLDRMLNAGGVRRSLVLTVTVVALAVALPWWQTTGPLDGLAERPGAPGSGALWPLNLGSLNGWPLVLWLLAVAAAICTVALSRHRLAALLCMGIVGLVVSLVFVGLSAPDLALTQLLVEGVTLLLMMLALRYLPAQSGTTPERDARKLRDAALSAITGLGLGAIAWAVMMRPFETRSAHYLERALPEAGGSNVVNVVIVDFRGFDTFGETMVMAAAGLVIHALLAGRTLHAVSGPSRLQAVSAQTQRPLLLAVLAWAVLPFALMVSVYFFLRGHNLPGGGFIAGLVTSIGLLLQQMAQGAHHTPDVSDSSDASARSVRDPASHAIRRWHQCIGAGLLLAALTGLGSWLVGYPFLTSSFGHPVLPVLGELPIASAAAFDLGVYLTVVGATLLALTDLARLALPANRTEASATRQDAPGTAAVGGPH